MHPGAILVALRCIPRLYAVTDGTAASGMPDGEYRLGAHAVTRCAGGVRLADGTLAGSSLTMFQAFENLMRVGLPMADARRCSEIPVEYVGVEDRGRIERGAFADFVVLDEALRLRLVVVEGELVEP